MKIKYKIGLTIIGILKIKFLNLNFVNFMPIDKFIRDGWTDQNYILEPHNKNYMCMHT